MHKTSAGLMYQGSLFATSGVSRAQGVSIIAGSGPCSAALNIEFAATHDPDIRSVSINPVANSLEILIVPPWFSQIPRPCLARVTPLATGILLGVACRASRKEQSCACYFTPAYPSGSSPERGLCFSSPHLPPVRPSPK
jgi:hypothetical protein